MVGWDGMVVSMDGCINRTFFFHFTELQKRTNSALHQLELFVCLIHYVPVNNFQLCQDGSSWFEPVLNI